MLLASCVPKLQPYIVRYQINNSQRYSTISDIVKKTNRYVPVADFYAGKSVLITGGTGFVGKVFIEKLLYSCSEIDKVYVLVRAQKDKSAEERLKEILEKPLFTRLKKERPENLEKIMPIAGDLAFNNLGLKADDEQTLIEKVSVVFHSAATIKFNEPLKVALNINVEGTKRLLNLSQRMKNMKAFVHISTAYSNTDKAVIDEKVYPAPKTLDEVYKFIDKYGDDVEHTEKFIDPRPNTYAFTKAIAEAEIAATHGSVPVVIVRPSMVKSGYREPLPGWIDGWTIPNSILFTVGKGFNRVVIGVDKTVVDFIPVDYLVNLSIVAAVRCNRSGKVAVYNCCSSTSNPITLQESLEIFCAESRKHGFNELPYPWALRSRSKHLIAIVTFIMQTLPAHFVDLWLELRGKKPWFAKMNKKVITLRDKSQFFTGTTWWIKSQRTLALAASLSVSDRSQFPCDPTDIDWKEFMRIHFHGMRQYLIGVKGEKK